MRRETGLSLEDLERGQARVADADGVRILLIRLDDEVRATSAWCTHARTLLGDQAVDDDGLIECPLHGAVFSSEDGSLLMGPTCEALPVYPVTVGDGGAIAVDVPEADAGAPAPRRAPSFGAWGTGRSSRSNETTNCAADRS